MNNVDIRALVPLPALSGPELAGTQLAVGDIVRARVVEAGAQGKPVLMLGGATLAMELPFPVTPGQSLEFTVLEVAPEVRLGVARPVAASVATPLPSDAGDLQISPEALLLSRLDRSLTRPTEAPPPAPLALPLPGSASGGLLEDPLALALALRQSVARSGLFYEHHQAQWVSGQRSEEQLRQEPQAGWPRSALGGAPLAEATDLLARLAAAGLGEEAIGMIRQQLDALQQQMLALRSEVAPGLVVDWQTRLDGDGQRRRDPQSRRWETELSSTFGALERVEARLALSGEHLQITLRASAEALQRMQAAGDELQAALAAAGLQLEALRFVELPSPVAEPAPAEAAAGGARPDAA